MKDTRSTPVLSVKNLKKSFAGKTVVDGVSFDIYPSEVIALVGENGAGKTTTKNMLCGLLEPTEGQVFIDSAPHTYGGERPQGVSAVHQELSLFGSLSVTENICISDLPGSKSRINWTEAQKIAQAQLDFLGIDIDPTAEVASLGAGKQQIVEIAKALLHADKVLILDEPTTSLTAVEREKLFAILEKLKASGVAIIFISHFLEEIYRVCDKYIVLRDGQQVSVGELANLPQNDLEEMMVGRTIGESKIRLGVPSERTVLQVDNLNSSDFADISFSVNAGEILGFAGLMGAGRTEVAEAVFGLRAATGSVRVNGETISPVTLDAMKRRNMCYVPEDRRTNGLFLNRAVRENLSAAAIHNFIERGKSRLGFKGERGKARDVVSEMNISIPHIENRVDALSGGNQQKVLLGRWLATAPRIFIFDEPTKGVDIGAKFDIHNRIADLAQQGATIVIVSSDLTELLNTCHRIVVMRKGRIVGEFERQNFDPAKIISLAASSVDTGVSHAE